ncbi:DMT family transporter [Streptomyces sp. HNM0574]|uniref:DMT family transporter n=1 Tax=Streptomyces sp. HNM0574 TaxID=2714954 RepID=UPI001469DB93|nr:DMT family transporter [Streptomyces sp. HNM0574]NLU69901.1 DMT family transporter [Streptomyces sp. HNM0574]
MSGLWTAVLLAVVSSLCYASAAIVQERLAATTPPSRYRLLASGRWWAAAALNGTGALLHAAALGLGPLTVVQPLGVLTLVLAAPLAAMLVRRPVGGTAWRGIALVSVGLAAILSLTGTATSRPLDGREQLLLTAAGGGGLALLLAVGLLARRGPGAVRTVSLAAAAGVAYGTASVFVKTVADGWSAASAVRSLPVLLLIGALALTGLAASQAAYRGGGLATPLATATVVNPAVAAAAGILLLDEGFRYGTAGGLGALAGALVTAWGLTVLATGGGLGTGQEPVPERGLGAVSVVPRERPVPCAREHGARHRPLSR